MAPKVQKVLEGTRAVIATTKLGTRVTTISLNVKKAPE